MREYGWKILFMENDKLHHSKKPGFEGLKIMSNFVNFQQNIVGAKDAGVMLLRALDSVCTPQISQS